MKEDFSIFRHDMCEGTFFHFGGHQIESVRTGRGEMFFEAGLVDEGKVSLQDFFRAFAIENAYEEGDHAFGNDGIGVRDVVHFPVFVSGIQPDLGLATTKEIFDAVMLGRHGGQFFAETDDIFVALRPVLEESEFVQNLLGFFGNAHGQEVNAEW